MAHIRWADAYQFFISNDKITYRDVADRFRISLDYVKEVGAREKWVAKRNQINHEALNLMHERTKEQILTRTQEHIALGKTLQTGAARQLAKGVLPQNAHDIASWIQAGIMLERRALGMNEKINEKTYIDTPQVKYHITYGDGAELDEY